MVALTEHMASTNKRPYARLEIQEEFVDKGDIQRIVAQAQSEAEAIRAADTHDYEERVLGLLASKGLKVTRLKRKSAQRYNVTTANASFGPVTLLDLERQCVKLGLLPE